MTLASKFELTDDVALSNLTVRTAADLPTMRSSSITDFPKRSLLCTNTDFAGFLARVGKNPFLLNSQRQQFRQQVLCMRKPKKLRQQRNLYRVGPAILQTPQTRTKRNGLSRPEKSPPLTLRPKLVPILTDVRLFGAARRLTGIAYIAGCSKLDSQFNL